MGKAQGGAGPPTHRQTPPWQRRSCTSGNGGTETHNPEVTQSLFRSSSRCRSSRHLRDGEFHRVEGVAVGLRGWAGADSGADTPILSPQKPILLQGHERSITQIKYNREGDLLFTVAKDPVSA